MAGLGSILANPLVISVLAADALSQTANAYRAAQNAPNPDDDRFITRALASGGPVESIEPNRGFFGRALQGAGLLSDTTRATPDQIAKEKLALQGQGRERLQEASTGAELASRVGHGNYNALMRAYHLGLPELPFETPSEIRANKVGSRDTAVELFRQPDGSGPDEITVPRSKLMSEGGPPTGYGTRPFKAPKTADEIEKEATARGVGAAKAVTKIDETIPLADRNSIRKSAYYDDFTGRKITGRQAATAKEAHDKGYVDIADKDAPTFVEMHQTLNAMRDFIAPGGPAEKIYVKTKGMNQAAAQAAIAKNAARIKGAQIPSWVPIVGGAHVFGLANIDPAIQDAHTQSLNQIQGLYSIQHRYSAGPELKLTADMMPSIYNSYEVNKQRYENLIKRFGGSITEGMIENRKSEAASDIVDSVSKAFSPEDTSTSDDRGPTILPPPPEETDREIEEP